MALEIGSIVKRKRTPAANLFSVCDASHGVDISLVGIGQRQRAPDLSDTALDAQLAASDARASR
ncbi:hypothetical protein B0G80_7452 [Paraburkholderia sp. BL6669N2]|nr:hypothetical protein B0G80_7445 [Paraburkholderia sp. BL6669N2]REG50975.1 hypothetical protein B0G80_7452 [Paraburkholderia sp. BL6669N2]